MSGNGPIGPSGPRDRSSSEYVPDSGPFLWSVPGSSEAGSAQKIGPSPVLIRRGVAISGRLGGFWSHSSHATHCAVVPAPKHRPQRRSERVHESVTVAVL